NQALNSMGTFLAPFFGSYFILSALEHATSAEAVEIPYAGLATVLLVIAFVISRLKLPVIEAEEVEDNSHDHVKKTSAWQYKHLVFGAIGIFAYVGGEVAIGSYLVNYFGMPDVAGLGEKDAAHLVAFYWGGAMVGRFLGAYLLSKIAPGKVLAFNALAVIAMVTISIMSKGDLAMYTMISVGLFNSIMFPTIFTLGIKNLGKFTTQGAGILSTAIVGGAFVPLLQGSLADMPSITLRYAFIVPIVCYAYIVWFGVKGHKTDEE
ncbi:MAG: glucose/galactose MFS transporter, partial [Cytophagales bacterium]|nr:glucose/galactose MFS transporter [Cytophagales bacterium]